MTAEDLPALVAERLTALRADFAAGQADLTRLDEQRETLRAALLRISGAIQALTELSEAGDQHDDSPTLVDVNAAGEHASSA